MAVAQSGETSVLCTKEWEILAYPRTYPTIDMTAADRVYLSLAANHDPVSGNISTNHSCKTGGNLPSY